MASNITRSDIERAMAALDEATFSEGDYLTMCFALKEAFASLPPTVQPDLITPGRWIHRSVDNFILGLHHLATTDDSKPLSDLLNFFIANEHVYRDDKERARFIMANGIHNQEVLEKLYSMKEWKQFIFHEYCRCRRTVTLMRADFKDPFIEATGKYALELSETHPYTIRAEVKYDSETIYDETRYTNYKKVVLDPNVILVRLCSDLLMNRTPIRTDALLDVMQQSCLGNNEVVEISTPTGVKLSRYVFPAHKIFVVKSTRANPLPRNTKISRGQLGEEGSKHLEITVTLVTD